jgi:hypothetical protein
LMTGAQCHSENAGRTAANRDDFVSVARRLECDEYEAG